MSETFDEAQAIVIDNGSGMCKAGLAGKDAPSIQFPSIVGRPRTQNIIGDTNIILIGDEAVAKKQVLNLKYPIEHGVVNDFDDMEKIWNHCFFNQLRESQEEHPCMLTEVPWNPKENREKMIKIMFEVFNVPSFYLQIQAVLSLYASGRTTGLVIASGDGVTYTVPVYEGVSMPHAVERIDLAGRDLSEYLVTILQEIYVNYSYSYLNEIIRFIKESLCYVALEPKKEAETISSPTQKDKPYQLPDGNTVILHDQLYRCPEVLFNPTLMEKDFKGIHTLAFNSILKCNLDVQKKLYKNVVLSGGSTMFPGIAERLSKEMSELSPLSTAIKIYAPPERKFSVWVGGSILSSLASFQTKWITKGEFDESGPAIVHRRCQ